MQKKGPEHSFAVNWKRAIGIWKGFLVRQWPIYALGAFLVMITDAMQVLATRNLGWIIDFFTDENPPFFLSPEIERRQSFFLLFMILLASRVIMTLGRMGWRFTLARQTHKATAYLRDRLWDRVRFFPRRDLNEYFTKGQLMNASTSDVGSARFIFGFTLVAVIDVLALLFFALGTLFSIHVPMTLIALFGLIGIPFLVRHLSRLEIQRYSKAQECLGHFNDLSSQVVSTIRLQRLTQTGTYWKQRLLESAENYRGRRLLSSFTSLRYIPLMGGSTVLTYLLLFSFGGYFVLYQNMSVGDFVAIQGLVFLLQDPLMEVGFIISEFQKGLTSLHRLGVVFDHEGESHLTESTSSSVFEQASSFLEAPVLETRNLSFIYPGQQLPVFEGLDLRLNEGDRLGVKGSIGSGKSSLMSVLSGIERQGVTGDDFFLGKAFSEYEHGELRRFIGYVHQNPFLFATNIRQNVGVDLPLSDEEVWHYLSIAGLADDVRTFPHQLETPLGEWGVNLSGGQKQRLTLARALARKPRILFLDDCLSAVDTVTEERILKNLDRELRQTTLIWVAHRDSTLKYCTQFLDMEKYRFEVDKASDGQRPFDQKSEAVYEY